MVQKKPSNIRVRDGGGHQAPTEDPQTSQPTRNYIRKAITKNFREAIAEETDNQEKQQALIELLSNQASNLILAPEHRVVVDIGLDISTSIVGFCALDSSGNMVNLGNIKLTSSKLEDPYDKANEVRSLFHKIVDLQRFEVRRIFVEEAHMKFTSGASSAKTLFSLAGFNQVVCQMSYDHFKVKPIKVGVRTARSKLGIRIDTKDKSTTTKEKVLAIVMTLHPEFPWESHVAKTGKRVGQVVHGPENFDMADAWVICRGGQVTNSLGTLTKSTSTSKKSKKQ